MRSEFKKIEGTTESDNMIGTNENEHFIGGRGHDEIITGDGNNFVRAGDENDYVRTGNGFNKVHLGDGNDLAEVGAGKTVVWTGEGSDTIWISADSGTTIIKDFTREEGNIDRIRLLGEMDEDGETFEEAAIFGTNDDGGLTMTYGDSVTVFEGYKSPDWSYYEMFIDRDDLVV